MTDTGTWMLEEEEGATAPSDDEMVMAARDAIGEKFRADDVTEDLYDAVERWLPGQLNSWSGFIKDVARKVGGGAMLSDAQVAAVLNTWVASLGPREKQPVTRISGDDDDRAYEAYLIHQYVMLTEGYYTLVNADGGHRTIQVGKWRDDRKNPGAKIRFFGVRKGSDYETFGMQREGLEPFIYRSHQEMGFQGILNYLTFHDAKEARIAYAVESGKCARCNRTLTHPDSIENGLGPECSEKV